MRWASYVITAVGYDRNRTHIAAVEVRVHNDTALGPPYVWARETVIKEMRKGFTFVTGFERSGFWNRGAMVEIVRVGGEEFLRTDGNQRLADNLGELPELPAQPGLPARW